MYPISIGSHYGFTQSLKFKLHIDVLLFIHSSMQFKSLDKSEMELLDQVIVMLHHLLAFFDCFGMLINEIETRCLLKVCKCIDIAVIVSFMRWLETELTLWFLDHFSLHRELWFQILSCSIHLSSLLPCITLHALEKLLIKVALIVIFGLYEDSSLVSILGLLQDNPST